MHRMVLSCASATVVAAFFMSIRAHAQVGGAAAPPVEPSGHAIDAQASSVPGAAADAVQRQDATSDVGSIAALSTIAARPDGIAIGVCGSQGVATLAAQVHAGAVEVAGGYAWTMGFAFEESELVVAPIEVASRGRGVEVTYEGRTMPATIAALDEDSGLVLLRVPGLHAVAPLRPSPLPIRMGTAVIGPTRVPSDDGGRLELIAGSVTQTAATGFSARPHGDVAYAWGAPLVDCAGLVLGVAHVGEAEVTPVEQVRALVSRVRAGAGPYQGEWSFGHPSFHALLEIDQTTEAWTGIDVGVALVGRDRYELVLGGRILGRQDPPSSPEDPPAIREWGVRGGADLRAGYRLMLNDGAFAFNLTPHLGGGFDVSARGADRVESRTLTSGCDADGGCPIVTRTEELPTEIRARVFPAAGVGLRFGFLDLDYTFRLDVAEPDRSSHQIGLGFQF